MISMESCIPGSYSVFTLPDTETETRDRIVRMRSYSSETETGANFHSNLYTFYRIGLALSVGWCE